MNLFNKSFLQAISFSAIALQVASAEVTQLAFDSFENKPGRKVLLDTPTEKGGLVWKEKTDSFRNVSSTTITQKGSAMSGWGYKSFPYLSLETIAGTEIHEIILETKLHLDFEKEGAMDPRACFQIGFADREGVLLGTSKTLSVAFLMTNEKTILWTIQREGTDIAGASGELTKDEDPKKPIEIKLIYSFDKKAVSFSVNGKMEVESKPLSASMNPPQEFKAAGFQFFNLSDQQAMIDEFGISTGR